MLLNFISSALLLRPVLFFAVDDLRPEITAFGIDGASPLPGTHVPPLHTPNIDALAKKSLVLTKNYVQQAVCSPTRTVRLPPSCSRLVC